MGRDSVLKRLIALALFIKISIESNSLIILENKILFKKPSRFSKPLAKLEKGRLLIIKKCKNKWCQVTTDNYKGWIDTNNIWGSIN